jgi:hypothetical protein
MRILVLVVALAGISLTTVSQAMSSNMPDELIGYAAKNGCQPVADFFKRPGMVNPPYAYGYISGQQEDSAALWCQTGQGEERKFFLLIMTKKPKLTKCPTRIEARNYPGGLSIYKDRRTTLDGFVYLADPKKRGPKDVRLSANGILSEYDGGEELFYCHEGAWLVRQRH